MKISVHRELLRLRQKNRCHWCKCEMTPTLPNRRVGDPPFPDTMCTLDHVFSRSDPRRGMPRVLRGYRRVAACLKCNRERGYQEVRAKQQQHGTSQSFQRF